MNDRGIVEALARIEAKVDALTDWSGMQDTNGNPITKVEMAERERISSEMRASWEASEPKRVEAAKANRWPFLSR